MNDWKLDRVRYPDGRIPKVVKYYRKVQSLKPKSPVWFFYKILFTLEKRNKMIELSEKTIIGAGLYLGHHYCITINAEARMGKNINLSKGVTIGQENRGKRKGAPTIGNNVWMGVNSTVVGKISIGDDVLIAPNAYVNCDIPSHSVVIGNPCVIIHKENATQGYLENLVWDWFSI